MSDQKNLTPVQMIEKICKARLQQIVANHSISLYEWEMMNFDLKIEQVETFMDRLFIDLSKYVLETDNEKKGMYVDTETTIADGPFQRYLDSRPKLRTIVRLLGFERKTIVVDARKWVNYISVVNRCPHSTEQWNTNKDKHVEFLLRKSKNTFDEVD